MISKHFSKDDYFTIYDTGNGEAEKLKKIFLDQDF
jgi:hypothetical protein